MKKDISNTTIGLIGGGQLGKMMIMEAKKMGFKVIVLDPAKDCPAHSICDEHIPLSLNDESAIRILSEKCDIITYEFEHINVDALLKLEEENVKIYPSPKSLKTIQNKYTQKAALLDADIPVPDFIYVENFESLEEAGRKFGYPFILKTCTGGYDGKGNFVVNSSDDLEEAYHYLGGSKAGLLAENFVNFNMEVSVIACRGIDGSLSVFPVAKNTHVNNILEETLAPAPVDKNISDRAMNIAGKALNLLEGVGIFCIEMFITESGEVLVNEIAPRPHNSGHYTIEACATSQFEQHIRAITGLPLGDSSLIRPAAMRNLLGEPGFSGPAVVKGMEDALKVKGAKVHIYGKAQTKPHRKMGHVTVCAETLSVAAELCKKAKNLIRIVSEKEDNYE